MREVILRTILSIAICLLGHYVLTIYQNTTFKPPVLLAAGYVLGVLFCFGMSLIDEYI